MSSVTLIAEAFGHIVYSFTRGVTEYYNPEEPEITARVFDPLLNNGREWFHHPVDEVIYQQYSYRKATAQDYLPSSAVRARLIDASSVEHPEVPDSQIEGDEAMAWKRLRPSVLLSACQSMYIGSLISFLTSTFVSSAFILTSIIISLLFIPRNTKALSPQEKSAEKLEANNKEQPASVFSVKKILELLHIPTVLYLITIKIITGIPFGIFQSMFSLVSMEFFKLEPQQNGFVMSYVGVLSIVAQGLIVGVLSRRFSEPFLLRGAICVIASAYGLLYMVTDIYQFCIVIIPMVVGGTTLNVITTSAMTKSVTVTKTGAVLGLSMATNSLIRTVSPTMGSIMYKNYGWPSIGLLGLVVNAAVAFTSDTRGREHGSQDG
ncbi:hypothetical protein pdam_00002609 [Pocillopora damicornis]|uniref:Major facilitator superfamily (MFS) profile domain-containing protein n=1 Tax=Pocillopora damicornis TaxID=46731 RepID=A0A3M6U3E6_POCDA|nr:hypothetical protein pdam_00002609 [Pocillopora damicornis]